MSFPSSQDKFNNNLKSICFTNFICNKSFCRSVKNNKFNILVKRNVEPARMLRDILRITKNDYDNTKAVNIFKLLSDTSKILLDLRDTFGQYSKDDFKSFFETLKSKYKDFNCVDVSEITKIILVILEKLVPSDFYGCNRNKKTFYDFIRFIMKGMLHQHITFERIVHKWDLNRVIWLNSVPNTDTKLMILCKFIIWLIKNTLCSIIAVRFYVTVTKMSQETRKLYFYFKEEWQRLSDGIISELVEKGDIVKCDNYSAGSKCKKSLPTDCRMENKFFLKRLPVMRLMLKTSSSVRVIIRYKKLCSFEKRIIKNRRTMFKYIFPNAQTVNFDRKYNEMYKIWKLQGEPKLYFVKADLKDAFGSVDLEALRAVLARLHNDFQKNEKNLDKKRIVAKEYQKLIADLRKPVLVRIGSCTYQWNRGLVQGMRFSPILCEIYYSDSDSRNLSDFSKDSTDEINLFIRYVDDYLFITDNIKSAFCFLKTLSQSGKVNLKKTICNFSYDGIETSSNISFFGYILNTHTLEVTRDEKVYCGQICYRISFSNGVSDPIKFLENRITQTTVPLTPLFFNLNINSDETLWKNIFTSLCISANKFCSIVTLIYSHTSNFNPERVFNVYKRKVAVRMCDAMVKIILETKPAELHFHFCVNHLRYLAYKALSLFASESNICSRFSQMLNVAMKKTNCMSGPWSSHYRSIDRDGTLVHLAVKEICRHQNTVKHLNECSKIPNGFEPFVK